MNTNLDKFKESCSFQDWHVFKFLVRNAAREDGRVKLDLNSVVLDNLSRKEFLESLNRISVAGKIRFKCGHWFVVNLRSLTITGSGGSKRTQYKKYYMRAYRAKKNVTTNHNMEQNYNINYCDKEDCRKNGAHQIFDSFALPSVYSGMLPSVYSRCVTHSESVSYHPRKLQADNVNGLQENANFVSVDFVEINSQKNIEDTKRTYSITYDEFGKPEKNNVDNAPKNPPSTPQKNTQRHREDHVCTSESWDSNGGTGGKERGEHHTHGEFSFQASNQFSNAASRIERSEILIPEEPDLDGAKKLCDLRGIPFEFGQNVYLTWWTRNGFDGKGIRVDFSRYVQARWIKEREDWKNGVHYLQKPFQNNTSQLPKASPPAPMAVHDRQKQPWQILKEVEFLEAEIEKSFANPRSANYDKDLPGYSEEKNRIIKYKARATELRKQAASDLAGI